MHAVDLKNKSPSRAIHRLLLVCLTTICLSCSSESIVNVEDPPAATPTPPPSAVDTKEAKPERDYSTEKLGEAGRYRISIRSRTLPIPLRDFHEWIVRVETLEGEPVQLNRLQVAGGMPEHGHGFPSQPAVTRYLGKGDFLIEGVQFNMEGLWQIAFRMDGPAGPDAVSFFLKLREQTGSAEGWSDSQTQLLASLALDSLPPVPADPSNRVSRDSRAVELGRKLFSEKGLSSTGEISCASCHEPETFFTDGRKLSQGLAETARHSPSLVGVGYASWFYWDGRRDSLWAQALTPLESLDEMGGTRVEVVRYVLEHPEYGPAYEAIFGRRPKLTRLPNRAGPFAEDEAQASWHKLTPTSRRLVDTAFANIGKSIAAFERELVPGPSRFDRYVKTLLEKGAEAADKVLSADELAGLRLFIDSNRTQCLRCHNGPMFSNYGFHNIGTGNLDGARLDFGRMVGMQSALLDPFNCIGEHSDCAKDDCKSLRFLSRDAHAVNDMRGAFKVPTLRNVTKTAPYFHDGRHATLKDVVEHYRQPPNPAKTGHELAQTQLSEVEARQLMAFLGTLTAE